MPQTGAMKDYAWLKQIAKELFSEDEIRMSGAGRPYKPHLCGYLELRQICLPASPATDRGINQPARRKISTELASQVGCSLIYFNAQTGVKVAEYIDGETMSPKA